MGGTDDPSNLIELSVEEHAEAHRILFEKHGLIQDFVAWKALSGIINKAEAVYLLAVARANSEHNPWKGKQTSTNFALSKENRIKATISAKSPKANSKRKETFDRIGHMKGAKNPAFGTVICRDSNGEKKRFKSGEIPDGWILSSEFHENKKKKNHSSYGMKWFNNGIQNFFLNPNSVPNDLKPGRIGSKKMVVND